LALSLKYFLAKKLSLKSKIFKKEAKKLDSKVQVAKDKV